MNEELKISLPRDTKDIFFSFYSVYTTDLDLQHQIEPGISFVHHYL